MFNNVLTCTEKNILLETMLTVGLDYILPLRSVKTWSNEPPWMTPELSSLIKKRQIALKQGNTLQFKYLRKRVNRKRKSCRAKYDAKLKVYSISNSVNHQLGGMKLRHLVVINLCIKIMKKFLEP